MFRVAARTRLGDASALTQRNKAMDFRITGLSPDPFVHLYGQSDAALKARNVIRVPVNAKPGFPDRIEMREGEIGEAMLLLNHLYQPALSPYRGCHAIYVREGATKAFDAINRIPPVMQSRLLALRAFDDQHMIIHAELGEGSELAALIQDLLARPRTRYIQAYNAGRGCFSGLIRPA